MTSAQFAIFCLIPVVMLWWNYAENIIDGHGEIGAFFTGILQTAFQLGVFIAGVVAIRWVWNNVAL